MALNIDKEIVRLTAPRPRCVAAGGETAMPPVEFPQDEHTYARQGHHATVQDGLLQKCTA